VEPGDAPGLSAYIGALAENAPYIGMTPGETPSPEKVRERIAEVGERPGSVGLLAEADGAVVGDCWMMAMPRVKMRHVGQIGMAIAEGWRGVGLGRALLERVVDHGRSSEHIWRIELGVLHENAPAIALYESLGFVREGYYPGRFRQPDGALLDDIIMGMWVGPGPDSAQIK
jgi:putative acetyltransferase